MKTAIFPLSADPITFGHLNIIDRALNVFDQLIIAVGENSSKKYTFSAEERVNFIKTSTTKHAERVWVESFKGLLSDFAFKNNVKTIVKGVRNLQDFDYERLLHEISLTQQRGIDTHILITEPALNHISSSAVKELCKHHGLIHEYVPYCVKFALEERINKQYIIGLTGQIATGKSFLEKKLNYIFRSGEVPRTPKNGGIKYEHIDLDLLAHSLYTRTEPVFLGLQKEIQNAFGLREFPIDRRELGEIVFSDVNKMQLLVKLIKPALLTLIREKLNEVAKQENESYPYTIVVLNGSLLVEFGFLHLCNNNIIVTNCSIKDQLENLKNRGLSAEQSTRRIQNQFSHREKINKILKEQSSTGFGNLFTFYYSDFKNNDLINYDARQLITDVYTKFKI